MEKTTRAWGRGKKEDQGLRYGNKFEIPIRYPSRDAEKAAFVRVCRSKKRIKLRI